MQLPGLQHYRKHAFLSQAELAAKSGVNITTIKRLEAGQEARGSTIRKLASALGVEPSALVEPLPEQHKMAI